MFFFNYFSIFIFFFIVLFISFVIFVLSYSLALQNVNQEKLSAYECGFNPFDDARVTFDVRFYLIAILFLIFDLEVSFLFPWSISLENLSVLDFWSMVLFLITLTIGFIYEWCKGALEWK